jgi:two-component system nitrate/nitrite response regulator NarL
MQVLVIDDHPIIHRVMETIVPMAFENAVICGALGLEAGLALATSAIALAILDLRLPGCVGIEALFRLRAARQDVPVVVFSSDDERQTIGAAFDAGAAGYVPKSTDPQLMVAALRLVAEGGRYVPPQAFGGRHVASGSVRITERQLEVLRLAAKGWSNIRIAEELDLASNTVKQHMHALFRVLGVASRFEAIHAAERLGIAVD